MTRRFDNRKAALNTTCSSGTPGCGPVEVLHRRRPRSYGARVDLAHDWGLDQLPTWTARMARIRAEAVGACRL